MLDLLYAVLLKLNVHPSDSKTLERQLLYTESKLI